MEGFEQEGSRVASPAASEPPVVEIAVGDEVCTVRVWTEERWEATPPGIRPSPATHVPGLGWVVAIGRSRP